MDDQRNGASLRALRIRRRITQKHAAAVAGISRHAVMLIEAGSFDRVRFGDIRAYAKALGARFDGVVRWQGADLDRMLNRGHALMHEAMARWLGSVGGWLAVPEVSFTDRGDRGVIDLVAWHAAARSVLIVELKTRIVDINELMATMDIRRRVARRLAAERGWDPVAISLWVVVAPGRTNSRILADHATVLRAKFPDDGRTLRGWISRPTGAIAALSFMPQDRLGDLGRDLTTPRRVRPRPTSVDQRRSPSNPRSQPRIGVEFGD